MRCPTRVLFALALLGGSLPTAEALAQTPAHLATESLRVEPGSRPAPLTDVLPGLPRPPEAPPSLFQPPLPHTEPPPLPGRRARN